MTAVTTLEPRHLFLELRPGTRLEQLAEILTVIGRELSEDDPTAFLSIGVNCPAEKRRKTLKGTLQGTAA